MSRILAIFIGFLTGKATINSRIVNAGTHN
jgi:hypothetical protein